MKKVLDVVGRRAIATTETSKIHLKEAVDLELVVHYKLSVCHVIVSFVRPGYLANSRSNRSRMSRKGHVASKQ